MDPTELELLIPRSLCQGLRFTPEFTSSLFQGGGGKSTLAMPRGARSRWYSFTQPAQLHLILKKVDDAALDKNLYSKILPSFSKQDSAIH